jgi:hypothetical protein
MMGVPKPGTKPPKEPLTEFQESLYRLEDGTYGFLRWPSSPPP